MMSIANKMVILFYIINGFIVPCNGQHVLIKSSTPESSDTILHFFGDTIVHPGPLWIPEPNVQDSTGQIDTSKVNRRKGKLKDEMMHLILAPGGSSDSTAKKS